MIKFLDHEGKGESNWDFWSHENNGANIDDRDNGDIACDSYNKFLEDVKLLKEMGVSRTLGNLKSNTSILIYPPFDLCIGPLLPVLSLVAPNRPNGSYRRRDQHGGD
jgi:hypothetical protein